MLSSHSRIYIGARETRGNNDPTLAKRQSSARRENGKSIGQRQVIDTKECRSSITRGLLF